MAEDDDQLAGMLERDVVVDRADIGDDLGVAVFGRNDPSGASGAVGP